MAGSLLQFIDIPFLSLEREKRVQLGESFLNSMVYAFCERARNRLCRGGAQVSARALNRFSLCDIYYYITKPMTIMMYAYFLLK